jgi:hypothetical protein
MTRFDYAKLPSDELRRRLRSAEDRSTRASTTAQYMADGFAMQELQAAMILRHADTDEPVAVRVLPDGTLAI